MISLRPSRILETWLGFCLSIWDTETFKAVAVNACYYIENETKAICTIYQSSHSPLSLLLGEMFEVSKISCFIISKSIIGRDSGKKVHAHVSSWSQGVLHHLHRWSQCPLGCV